MITKLKVENVKTERLVPYANNAKEHPDWQVEQIAASIEQFGFSDPVGVWQDEYGELQIVEGHGRVLAAKLLGMEAVPCIRLNHMDDEARRAYTRVHNALNANTGSDWAVLQEEIAAMPEFQWDAFGMAKPFDAQSNGTKEIDLEELAEDAFEKQCPRCGFMF